MKMNSQHILRLLAVILLLSGMSGRGSVAYALDGSGTSGDPYKIGSLQDWLDFVNRINSPSISPTNVYAIMTSDVTVDITNTDNHPDQRMVGYRGKVDTETFYRWSYFNGTFDGRGHTLTFNYDNNNTYKSGSTTYHDGEYIAPFKGVSGCTIKNLKVAGTIKTSKKFASGIVAFVYTNGIIENCISSITIESTCNGDGTHGGFVANSDNPTKITDCGGLVR